MRLFNCPICDKTTTYTAGYGLAAGPIGMYCYCDSCDNLVDFMADTDHIEDDEEKRQVQLRDIAALYYHIECARIQYAGEQKK